MPIEIAVPRLGWSMDEGTFGEWLKNDGEFIKEWRHDLCAGRRKGVAGN